MTQSVHRLSYRAAAFPLRSGHRIEESRQSREAQWNDWPSRVACQVQHSPGPHTCRHAILPHSPQNAILPNQVDRANALHVGDRCLFRSNRRLLRRLIGHGESRLSESHEEACVHLCRRAQSSHKRGSKSVYFCFWNSISKSRGQNAGS